MNIENREQQRSLSRKQLRQREERRKQKQREENILILICSIILAIIISIVWNMLTFTAGVFFPPKAKMIEKNVAQYIMLPEAYGKYFDLPYMKTEYFDRYLDYEKQNPDYSLEDIVTHCNMGIDVEFFARDAITVNDTNTLELVINKVYKLPDTYKPSDLMIVDDYRDQTMREEAALAFQDMKEECENLGFDLLAYSGYRSTDLQTSIYNNMVSSRGEEYTNQFVSKPGHSEHTTGLAMDISLNGLEYTKSEESEYYQEFLALISDFGFIIRYPEGKEHLTGYGYESWHLRYVGVEIAKEIESSGLTLDEYVARLY